MDKALDMVNNSKAVPSLQPNIPGDAVMWIQARVLSLQCTKDIMASIPVLHPKNIEFLMWPGCR
jgi:hypothetical protein